VVALKEGITTATIRTKIVIIATSTTVSAIPAAATVVVVVVAVTILPERVHRTRSVAVDPWILACAVCTVLVALVSATTVASVPSATTSIIPVVTIFVAFPGLDTRQSVRLGGRTFFSLLLFVARAIALATIAAKLRLEGLACIVCFAVQLIASMPVTSCWTGFFRFWNGFEVWEAR